MKGAGRQDTLLMGWRRAAGQPLPLLCPDFSGGPLHLTRGVRPIIRYIKETHSRVQMGEVP